MSNEARHSSAGCVGRRFFHINVTQWHDPRPLLSVGDRISAGVEENPFFRYYRHFTREFSVRNADGTETQTTGLELLRLAEIGIIKSDEAVKHAHTIAKHFQLLARELLWETIRLREFSCLPSRQSCIWLVSDISILELWENTLVEHVSCFQYVEFVATGVAHACDAAYLSGDSDLLGESERKAEAYWRGDMLATGSQPEILFAGHLEVLRVWTT